MGLPKNMLAFTVTIIIGDVKIISGVQVITTDQGTPFIQAHNHTLYMY